MIRLCIYYRDPEIRLGGDSRSHRKFSSAPRAPVWSKDKGGGRASGSLPWIPHCYLSYLRPTASIRKERPSFSQTLKKLNFNAPINIMPAGREGRAWGGDLIVVVGPGVGHLSDLVLPGEGIFESFFARRGDWRLGRKRLRPNICFPLPRFTHAPYGLERSGNHGGQREQAEAQWISLFCLQISYHVF